MKSPFNSPSPTLHEVGGKEFKFYPTRTSTVGRLRGFLKPLFSAMASLAGDQDRDIGREHVDEQGADGSIKRRTVLSPIDPTLSKQRTQERENSIAVLVDNVTSGPGLRSLALLVTDSLRDDFEANPKDSELDELLLEMGIDQMLEALHGVAKASKEVFAPLMQRVSPGLATLKERLAKVPAEEPPSKPQPE